ncbi:MAG TPA: DUF4386 domain-containing protein [Anaerolineaceae bacterium]|nr:DUF4386 domain-containing protein [Anaerolineaceae bacterium]
MSNHTESTSINKTAHITGWLYLSLVPLGFLGIFTSSGILVPGDAAAIANHILASETLFRLGIVVAFLVQIVNILVVLGLYRLLKPVDRSMAVLMVIFLLLGVPIAMLNELNQFAVLFLVHDAGHLTAFTGNQLQALVPFFLDLHQLGISIAGIFWGLWLFPMGYLVFKSGFLPRILGILLIIGCAGYLVESFAAFLFPSFDVNIALFTFWGEVLLPLWLVIKGVNVEKWHLRAAVSA